jgi:hypothetical protein
VTGYGGAPLAINRIEVGRGFEAGLSIVLLAILIDRTPMPLPHVSSTVRQVIRRARHGGVFRWSRVESAIFIDGSNLYHALEGTLKRHDLDFTAVCRQAVWRQASLSCLLLTMRYKDVAVRPDAFREQQEFLDGLRKTPYLEVRLGTIKTSRDAGGEGGVGGSTSCSAPTCSTFAWNNSTIPPCW